MEVTMLEVETIDKNYYFNGTTLGYLITPIKDQLYYVGSFHTIPYVEFQIYPAGYIDASNYTLNLTDDPSKLQTPLDLDL